jgi:hypothetical protein
MKKLITAIVIVGGLVLLATFSLNAHYSHGYDAEDVNIERKVLKNGIQVTITTDDAALAEELKKADPDDCPYLGGAGDGMHRGSDYDNDEDCHGYGRSRGGYNYHGNMMH